MTSTMEDIDFTAVNWQSTPVEDGLLWKPASARFLVDGIYLDEEPLELLPLAHNHKVLLPSAADLAQYAHLDDDDEVDVETINDDIMVLSDEDRDGDYVPALSDDDTSSIASSASAPATPDFGPSFSENDAMMLEEPVALDLDVEFDADDEDDDDMEESFSNASTPKARPHTMLP